MSSGDVFQFYLDVRLNWFPITTIVANELILGDHAKIGSHPISSGSMGFYGFGAESFTNGYYFVLIVFDGVVEVSRKGSGLDISFLCELFV